MDNKIILEDKTKEELIVMLKTTWTKYSLLSTMFDTAAEYGLSDCVYDDEEYMQAQEQLESMNNG